MKPNGTVRTGDKGLVLECGSNGVKALEDRDDCRREQRNPGSYYPEGSLVAELRLVVILDLHRFPEADVRE